MRSIANTFAIYSAVLLSACYGHAGIKYFLNTTKDESASVELIPQQDPSQVATVDVKPGKWALIRYRGAFAKQIAFKYQRNNMIMPAKIMWDKDRINENTIFVMTVDGVKMFPWPAFDRKPRTGGKPGKLRGGAPARDDDDEPAVITDDDTDADVSAEALGGGRRPRPTR